ncbi:hypothetical protein PRZ48_011867 [Zasmidium cellare]|uniref:Uncharacterized protein n=1 Tax=Zasmidium cellare TaxID=395010 RepID=A0ABR0E7L0_ZASCE|nr:hypothetical protein PRZ48_011867 [Zasmidium cellare]
MRFFTAVSLPLCLGPTVLAVALPQVGNPAPSRGSTCGAKLGPIKRWEPSDDVEDSNGFEARNVSSILSERAAVGDTINVPGTNLIIQITKLGATGAVYGSNALDRVFSGLFDYFNDSPGLPEYDFCYSITHGGSVLFDQVAVRLQNQVPGSSLTDNLQGKLGPVLSALYYEFKSSGITAFSAMITRNSLVEAAFSLNEVRPT